MTGEEAATLCRDCGTRGFAGSVQRCPACGGPRLQRHPELHTLAIAHIDCDAFYASVEKRDNPALLDRPVIVGGGHRGVVSACCYIARLYGVRSAMPMFKALKACPEAVVIRPEMKKYVAVGRQVRTLMQALTPLVEPISIDEAFLDLSGTEALHGGSPAQSLVRLIRRIETEVGITASVGLSYNKFLAKVASDLDKPRGFSVIGRAEAVEFLGSKPVGLIWGVGAALREKLAADGITLIGHLRGLDERTLVRRYGAIGGRLHRFARGEDARTVTPDSPTKSVSGETTFDTDIADPDELARRLWPLCETVARRLKASHLAGRTVTLKLKTSGFQTKTRSRRLADPTQLADRLFRTGEAMLRDEAVAAPTVKYRLIGIGVTDLSEDRTADPPDLLDPAGNRRAKAERAIDAVRAKLGADVIGTGRSLGAPKRRYDPADDPDIN